ncbi:3-phosphoshikimate 1-carboxyvinyltransferase [uncultured Tyzzerella sp.]|uniref:3-phosphoshikimate 1-carboxyvinyltransferase n=1 Tax=uncultured Tyzzerella sp. TaxID=2321398 RepID=UPI002941F538|nr:3-phosphoshikimate 1-carboxyvinyltransferase [uncultured Tyzzerella sp.]
MEKKLIYNKNLNGKTTVLGDKSISHRAIILGALAEGVTTIKGFLKGEDCISTIKCFKDLGINITEKDDIIEVYGNGLYGFKKPKEALYVGNSGTTIRLISGILSAQNFSCTITGDSSIVKRPMKRIIEPLSLMGANINSNECFAPLHIQGTSLNGVEYNMPIASAQVKSSILLASLYASSKTVVTEKFKSRNHSEIMLKYFGADININGNIIESKPISKLSSQNIEICGDISSACFIIVGALITKNSHIVIENVGINPTRTGFLEVLLKMGANIKFLNVRYINGEKVCDIEVKSSYLKAYNISGEIIPRMIDEIPLFALVASLADGTSIVKDASELKFKESNRIKTISTELNKIGANIIETDDGMIIEGNKNFIANKCESYNDHRIAMCIAVASLICKEPIILNNYNCIKISFPTFFDILENL